MLSECNNMCEHYKFKLTCILFSIKCELSNSVTTRSQSAPQLNFIETQCTCLQNATHNRHKQFKPKKNYTILSQADKSHTIHLQI